MSKSQCPNCLVLQFEVGADAGGVMPVRGQKVILVLALTACSQPAASDLGVALKGIEQSRFLACSGPPVLSYPQGNQLRMSFVTALDRGASIGIAGPTALPPASCSVGALFENSRLVAANFSGDVTMCQLVFACCVQH
jgi:hypothetical protein